MTRPKILLLGEIEHAHDAWKAVTDAADVVKPKATNRDEFLAECKSGAFDGVSAIYRTGESAAITGNVDVGFLDALPKSIKFICHRAAGYDQIDVDACTAREICVSNVPTAVNDATADTNMFLILGALRNFPAGMAALRRGEWRGSDLALGHDPRGKILGILGMGGIGRNLADKARAFGMQIRYHNRRKLDPEHEEGAEYVDFETLLKESDVLSLNLPLNPSTRHTISKDQFAIMKPGIVIVNTARGAVMDEAALVEALDSGRVASAGLDVFEDEPNVHEGLLKNDRVLLVPHLGTYTIETMIKMEAFAINNVKKAALEGALITIVPEQRDLEAKLLEGRDV
ncbi:hypothetical protein V2G26_021071 [Clonostachys chloroleuca]